MAEAYDCTLKAYDRLDSLSMNRWVGQQVEVLSRARGSSDDVLSTGVVIKISPSCARRGYGKVFVAENPDEPTIGRWLYSDTLRIVTLMGRRH